MAITAKGRGFPRGGNRTNTIYQPLPRGKPYPRLSPSQRPRGKVYPRLSPSQRKRPIGHSK